VGSVLFFGVGHTDATNTGDITAVRIVKNTCTTGITCNGWVAEIDIAGLGMGGTYNFGLGTNNNPSTAKIALTLTSPGYDANGNATTITRTVYGTYWLRLAYPNNATADETAGAGYVTVRVGLSDFVYSGDTSVTANITSGFYTQGGTPNNAATGISVTNNSTQTYPTSVGRWATVAYQRVTGNFQIEAVVFNRFAQNEKPVAAVAFTCSDQHGNTTAPVIVNNMTVSTQPGDQHAVLVYAATIPVSTLTQGDVLTCNFKAYPWVGDSGSVLDSSSTVGTIDVATLHAGGGGTGYAVNDVGTISGGAGNATYKVLTVSSGAVATFSLTYGGTGYSTASAAATTATSGIGTGFTIDTTVYRGLAGHEALAPLVMLLDKTGAYGSSFAVVDPTNGHASAAATWVAATQATAEANYVSSSANSYTTIGYAAQALKAYNNANYGRNDPGGGTILLATGTNVYPGTSPGSTLGAQNTWMTITTISSGGGAITSGTIATLNVQRVKFSGITLSGSSVGEFYSGNTTTDDLWVDNCALNLTGDVSFYYWQLGYATRNTITNLANGFMEYAAGKLPWVLVRGNSAASAGSTTGIYATQYAVLGNKNITPFYQINGATSAYNARSDGSVVAYNSFYNYSTTAVSNDDLAPVTSGIAIIQNIAELTSSATSMNIFEVSNANDSNVLLWYNTLVGGRIDQAYDYTGAPAPGQLYMWNWSHIGNIYENYNYNGDATAPVDATHYGNMAVDYAVGQNGNYKRTSSSGSSPGLGSFFGNFLGLNSIYGGTTMGFVNDAAYNDASEGGTDSGNGNYHLTSSSPALNLISSGQAVLPFDPDGNARKNDGTGAAGAYEYIPPAPTITGVSPSTGTTLGGTSVTITGTNLTGATIVDFGSNAATGVSVTNSTTMTATSPATTTAGIADVTVTTPGGVSTTGASDHFTYVTSTYTIGGTISGLTGTFVLQDNGGDNFSTSTSGTFAFTTALTNGSTYNVTVFTQPSGQICAVSNGSGTVSSSNVTTVSVSCDTTPLISSVSTITTPSTNKTPSFSFTSSESGTLLSAGSCTPSSTTVSSGSNSFTFNTLSDGTYSNCAFSVIDASGNDSATTTLSSFLIDTTGPTGSISNGSASPTNNVTPTLNLTIADAGVGTGGAQMRLSCDNIAYSSWSAFSTPITTFNVDTGAGCTNTDGTKTVYAQFEDSLLNIGSAYNTGSFTLDTVNPNASLSNTPATYGIYTGSTSASIAVAGTDVVNYEYKLDSGSYGASTPVAMPITLSSLSEGSHTVSVIGKTPSGTWQSTSAPTIYSWTVDLTGPVFSSTFSPINNGTMSKTDSFSWSTTDALSGIASYSFTLDGSSVASSLTSDSYTPASSLVCGSHTWSVRAFDNVGNSTDSNTMAVTVSCPSTTTAPVVNGSISPVFIPPPVATPMTSATTSGLTDSQIQSILSLLESFGGIDVATIANVQSVLSGTENTTTTTTSYQFTRNLSLHDTGADVKALQQLLNVTPTGYFGVKTYQALIKYQKSTGLPVTGWFGPMTREAVGKGE
jgi:hypothetical protein